MKRASLSFPLAEFLVDSFGPNGQFSALIVRWAFSPSSSFLIARLPSKKKKEEETTFPAEAGNFPACPNEKVSVGAVELSASF
jgi:hypothetical protein